MGRVSEIQDRAIASQKTTFLTGSTGFIGQYLLRELLDRDQRVVVLLRGGPRDSGLRLAQIMAPLGVDTESARRDGRLVIAEGHLPHDLSPLAGIRVDQIIHSAACLQVGSPGAGEPFATNVEGVRAVAAWADAHQVEHFHFVSTAYTCGRDQPRALEVFHTPRPRFVTDYEMSKWMAEEILLSWAKRTDRRLTILRPSLVIGDSLSGYTTQYGGFYQLGHMVEVLAQTFGGPRRGGRLYLPMRIPARPGDRQNLVLVDYAARAIVHIVSQRDLYGRIYHVTNPQPPTNEQVKSWLEDYFHVTGGHFVEQVDNRTSESAAENLFLRLNDIILQQFKFVPEFDCSNTLAALAGTPLTFPLLDRAMAFRLLDYARAHRWGRFAAAAS